MPLILRLARPNLVVMLLHASTGLVDTYWVGQLGPDALAGIALVFPVFMLMQMLSIESMGNGLAGPVRTRIDAGKQLQP